MATPNNESKEANLWTRRARTIHSFNSNIILLDNNSFIIAPYNYKHQKSLGLSIYDAAKNKWKLFIKYTPDLVTSYHTMHHDTDSNMLFLFGEEANMTKIDVNSYKCCQALNFSKKCSVGRKPEFFKYGKKTHILLGNNSTDDIIWNKKTNEFTPKHSFKALVKGLGGRGLVHVPSQNGAGKLLLFGGYHSELVLNLVQ
eukprot:UN08348